MLKPLEKSEPAFNDLCKKIDALVFKTSAFKEHVLVSGVVDHEILPNDLDPFATIPGYHEFHQARRIEEEQNLAAPVVGSLAIELAA